jgi:multicomponent Na+:H+ antiporter subunit G
LNIFGLVVISAGLFFLAVSSVGLFRLPGFFARVHAVSKSETLGIALVLLGLMIHEGVSLVSLKLGLIVVFVAMANPVAAHLLTRAAVRTGILPVGFPSPSVAPSVTSAPAPTSATDPNDNPSSNDDTAGLN